MERRIVRMSRLGSLHWDICLRCSASRRSLILLLCRKLLRRLCPESSSRPIINKLLFRDREPAIVKLARFGADLAKHHVDGLALFLPLRRICLSSGRSHPVIRATVGKFHSMRHSLLVEELSPPECMASVTVMVPVRLINVQAHLEVGKTLRHIR